MNITSRELLEEFNFRFVGKRGQYVGMFGKAEGSTGKSLVRVIALEI